jgi:arsenate reductase-like glutaredoxin family protein
LYENLIEFLKSKHTKTSKAVLEFLKENKDTYIETLKKYEKNQLKEEETKYFFSKIYNLTNWITRNIKNINNKNYVDDKVNKFVYFIFPFLE